MSRSPARCDQTLPVASSHIRKTPLYSPEASKWSTCPATTGSNPTPEEQTIQKVTRYGSPPSSSLATWWKVSMKIG